VQDSKSNNKPRSNPFGGGGYQKGGGGSSSNNEYGDRK